MSKLHVGSLSTGGLNRLFTLSCYVSPALLLVAYVFLRLNEEYPVDFKLFGLLVLESILKIH
jgi:hypothetical protein